MQQRQTHNLLIRNIPAAVNFLLEKSAKKNHRSKTQEAIIALTNGLCIYRHQVKKPKPFKWTNKISSNFIKQAIDEGRV